MSSLKGGRRPLAGRAPYRRFAPLPPEGEARRLTASPEGKPKRKWNLIRRTESDTFPRGEGYKERNLISQPFG